MNICSVMLRTKMYVRISCYDEMFSLLQGQISAANAMLKQMSSDNQILTGNLEVSNK